MARPRSRAVPRPQDRDDAGSTRIHGDGRTTRIPAAARTTRIQGDGRTTRIPGDGRTTRSRGGGTMPKPGDGRTTPHGGDGRTRRGPAHCRAGGGFGSGLRLVVRASRRFARLAGAASTASVTTADPEGRPLPTRPGGAGRWRYAARNGPGAPVLVIGTLMVLIVAMLGVERVTGVSVLPERLFAGLRPPPKDFPVLPGSPPTDIAIQKLDLRAPVHPVGIAPDGSIAVPDVGRSGEAGWYDQGPTPGQYGPAVIVGHVDTTTGPAVFHGLKSLDDGDRVEVTRADRSVAVFEVTGVQRYGKDRLPVDEVFGDFSRPNLRLITCGGRWVGGETGYADNLVVYASLVKARGP